MQIKTRRASEEIAEEIVKLKRRGRMKRITDNLAAELTGVPGFTLSRGDRAISSLQLQADLQSLDDSREKIAEIIAVYLPPDVSTTQADKIIRLLKGEE